MQIVSVAKKRESDIENSFRSYTRPFIWAGFEKPYLKSITYISPIEFKVPFFDKLIKINGAPNKSVNLNDNLMYFAGQPLPDMGLVNIDYYLVKLQSLKAKFVHHQIIYIPHPKETEPVKAKIAEVFKIEYFDTVFEQKYFETDFFARNIVSFYSSVLINLFYLAGGELNIYALILDEEAILLPENKDSILNIYKNFGAIKNSKFCLLNL